ncbi:hypothetical protein GFK82_00685 [Candidatus Steffania adelgidicola]|nr:hypothetical protein GFK82_00685 [Candidatus Steffania adelgidicola]
MCASILFRLHPNYKIPVVLITLSYSSKTKILWFYLDASLKEAFYAQKKSGDIFCLSVQGINQYYLYPKFFQLGIDHALAFPGIFIPAILYEKLLLYQCVYKYERQNSHVGPELSWLVKQQIDSCRSKL